MNERNAQFIWMELEGGVGQVELPGKVSDVMATIEAGAPHLDPDYAIDLVEALKEDAKRHFWPPLLFGATVLFFNNVAAMLEIPEDSITPTVKAIVKLYGEIADEGMTDEQRARGELVLVGGNDDGFWIKEVEDGDSPNP